MSRSSPIYSLHLARHHTRQFLLAITLVAFTRHHTSRVLFAIVIAAGILIDILFMDVVLIVSCLIRQSPPVVTRAQQYYSR
jgi:predicted membrane protein